MFCVRGLSFWVVATLALLATGGSNAALAATIKYRCDATLDPMGKEQTRKAILEFVDNNKVNVGGLPTFTTKSYQGMDRGDTVLWSVVDGGQNLACTWRKSKKTGACLDEAANLMVVFGECQPTSLSVQ
jgi:hypothetical protein